MKKMYKKFEKSMESFGVMLSDSLSSMTMFWIISILVIVPLFFSQPVGIVGWMQYLVSVFFQGVALPVLAYTSKISGARSDRVINKIKKLSTNIETLTKQIEILIKNVDVKIDDIDDEVESIMEDHKDQETENNKTK